MALVGKDLFKLNPKKCTFGVSSGMGAVISQSGVEPNPDKILAMTSPRNMK